MADLIFDNLFNETTTVPMSVEHLAQWFKCDGEGRLRLPPIQRSFVWSNEQILNYWDSLMRGYPAGMMMVHRAIANSGRDGDGQTKNAARGEFHLFDGQQRLSAILLGLGTGPLSNARRIWIDLAEKEGSGDRLFELRINSEGQPFGYKPDKPNEKPSIKERREKKKEWPKSHERPVPPDEIFRTLRRGTNPTLIKAKCPVPLAPLLMMIRKCGNEEDATKALVALGAELSIAQMLQRSLRKALRTQIVVTLVSGAFLENADEYVRFFGRVGQGGTRLSDDELTYSLIKNAYPHVHDRMREIMSGPEAPGRFASEVDLVLAALRISKTIAWNDAKEWEKAGRPTPTLIGRLQNGEAALAGVKDYFLSLLPQSGEARLLTALKNLRCGLLYDSSNNPTGLPSMLLARLPRDLVDVLLLFAIKRGETKPWEAEDRKTLISFALYWLLFVSNDDKAGYQCFVEAANLTWSFAQSSAAALIHLLEKEAARPAPRKEHWSLLYTEVAERGQKLAGWNDRFKGADNGAGTKPGEALRALSTNGELIRRALIWLQRSYISREFSDYNPMSTRDDDLPLDLDHAVPHDLFGRHWNDAKSKPKISGPDLQAFQWERGVVGNSLGNYRWLAASDNRRRGKDEIESDIEEKPLHDDIERASWNALIGNDGNVSGWSGDDVATFQRLIDNRTLRLTQKLLDESGVAELISTSDAENVPAAPPNRA